MAASPVRLGLIGAGRWGRNFIPTIAAVDGVDLVRIADPDAACATTGDWQDVVAADDVDAVIVATPPVLHAEMIEAAVAAGRPVLVEKPLTLDLEQALAVQRSVAGCGGLVMVDHIHLFNPAYRRLRELAAELGPPSGIRAEAGNHGPYRTDAPVLWDWGAHDVAMCLDLLGAVPEGVAAERTVNDARGEILDLRLDFPGGIVADIRIGNIMDKRRRFAVYFDGGHLLFDDLAADKLTRHPPHGAPPDLSPEPSLTCAVREFAEAVRNGETATDSLDLGVAVVEVLARLEDAL